MVDFLLSNIQSPPLLEDSGDTPCGWIIAAFALLALVIDVALTLEWLSLIALGTLSALTAFHLNLSWWLSIFVGLGSLALYASVWWTFVAGPVRRTIHRHLAPDRFESGVEALKGAGGVVVENSGGLLVRIEGTLWSSKSDDRLAVGQEVQVVDVIEGILIVNRLQGKGPG